MVQNWFGGRTLVGGGEEDESDEWRELGVQNMLGIVDSVRTVKQSESLKLELLVLCAKLVGW